jgi:hypothetical protein
MLTVGLDGRGFVNHARIVEQHHRPGFAQCEALPIGACGLEDARLTTLDPFAIYQEYRNQIHAIAVRALGRGAANATLGINAELVCLDEPRLGPGRQGLLRQATQGPHQTAPNRRLYGGIPHGGKPALHAAMQGVVLHGLPVGAVGCLAYRAPIHNEARMAPAAVTSAVFQKVVRGQIGPVRRKRLQISQITAQPDCGVMRLQHGITAVTQLLRHLARWGVGRRKADMCHGASLTTWRLLFWPVCTKILRDQ